MISPLVLDEDPVSSVSPGSSPNNLANPDENAFNIVDKIPPPLEEPLLEELEEEFSVEEVDPDVVYAGALLTLVSGFLPENVPNID